MTIPMSTLQIIIASYIGIIALLIIVSLQLARHQKRFAMVFTYDIDFVFYEMARQIEREKETIYGQSDSLDVLYHDKQRIFSKPVLSYQQQFAKIKENMDFLEKLLNKSIFSTKFRKRLEENYQTLQRIGKISSATHIMLIFLTLGIAKIRA